MEDSQEIWQITKEIESCQHDALGNFLKIGALFSAAQDGKRYMKYANHVKNFDDFIKEMGFKRAFVYNAIAVRKQFGDEIISNHLSCDTTRLIRMLPLNLNEDEKVEFLHKASTLTPQGFEDALREKKGEKPTDTCEHPETEPWSKCKVCSKFFK